MYVPDYSLILWAILVAHVAGCVFFARLLLRVRPSWSPHRIAFLSALPIPLLVWAFCVWIFVDASNATAEECGVDACGMAVASAMFTGLATLLVYLMGIGIAALSIAFVKNRLR